MFVSSPLALDCMATQAKSCFNTLMECLHVGAGVCERAFLHDLQQVAVCVQAELSSQSSQNLEMVFSVIHCIRFFERAIS